MTSATKKVGAHGVDGGQSRGCANPPKITEVGTFSGWIYLALKSGPERALVLSLVKVRRHPDMEQNVQLDSFIYIKLVIC